MKMQERFKQTFDEVHAPEDLLGKVMELHMQKKEFKTRNLVKAAVCVLAVTMGVFAAGNGICYAATGESLMTKVRIIIDGEEIQPMDMEWEKNGDKYTGSIIWSDEEGSSSRGLVLTTDENPEDVVIDITTEEETVEDDKVEEIVVMEIDEEDAASIMYEKQESANSSEDMDDSE